LIIVGVASAEEAARPAIDTGDTAWMLASAALVLVMTPALALFYGGMVRHRNVLGTIMHSFFMIALISVQWLVIGYSLAFGPDLGHIVGGWTGYFCAASVWNRTPTTPRRFRTNVSWCTKRCSR